MRTKWGLTTKNGQEKSNIRVDIDFSEEIGINVNATNLKLCLDFFLSPFTQEVWHLLVCQTNLYAQQMREQTESSV